jgi:hypothetical protein
LKGDRAVGPVDVLRETICRMTSCHVRAARAGSPYCKQTWAICRFMAACRVASFRVLTRTFHTFGFGAPILNRLSASSRSPSRLQVGAPYCRHFARGMNFPG